jgi:hypothetical protein
MAMRPGPEGHAVAGAAEVLDRTGLAPLRDTVAERTPGERAFVLLDLSDHDAVDGEAVTAIAEAVAHARRDGVGLAIMPPPAAVASYVLNAGDPGELTFLPELRAA